MGGGKRRPTASRTGKSLGRTLFVPGPHLDDWNAVTSSSGTDRRGSRSSGKRGSGFATPSRARGFSYSYPNQQLDSPILLLDDAGSGTPIVAFDDRTPCNDPSANVPAYDCDPSSIGMSDHFGLGFHNEEEFEVGEETKDGAVKDKKKKEKKTRRSDAFIAIGGVKVYTTEDVLSDGSDGDEEDDYEVDDGSSDSEDECSEDDSMSSDYDEDGTEIDEEVMRDYLEGIGGASQLFTGVCLEESLDVLEGDDSDEDSIDGNAGKVAGVALMKASEGYGMFMKSRRGRGGWKGRGGGSPMEDLGMLALDDVEFEKDSRTFSRKKNNLSQFSRSWPIGSYKSKKIHGEKKKQRKARIAAKRRERLLNRGVDLEQINLKLRQMVLNEVDMFSFQPMHSRDCSQVQRLASIYRLRSGCEGSGKKRFVTVTRTAHTCLPSADDNLRLEKLLGYNADDFFSSPKEFLSEKAKGNVKMKKVHMSAPGKLLDSISHSNKGGGGKKKHAMREGRDSYASRPVSFVSSGVMQTDPVEVIEVDTMPEYVLSGDANEKSSLIPPISNDASCSGSLHKVASFEMHTKGFGSRMLAKMGFVEGGGLGKDGQGIAQPIEAVKRPKSLGLGIEFSDATNSENKEASSGKIDKHGNLPRMSNKMNMGGLGAFEKHTKGFGSKMMSKMGFVPGNGLGKDGQGIINPLTAVKLPKSRGLGAKT